MRNLRVRSVAATLVISGLVAGLVTNPVTASTAGAATSGATATCAEPPGTTPNYILPLLTGAYYSVANIEQFQRLSYRSLFWIGDKGKPVVNPTLSLAKLPTYSNNNTVVNINLGKWNWSDGTPVTSRDVTFWINLLEANKKNIAFYIPGEFPDNLKSYKVTGPESIQLTLTGAGKPDLVHLRPALANNAHPAADLGQDLGFGRHRQLRPDQGGRRAGLQLPYGAVENHRHLRD